MIFGRFFSLLKMHHTLALLSVVRLHAVQAAMNLRQGLEAGASAAFAIANPEVQHFAETDAQGLLDPSQDLARKRYKWLDQHYRGKSDWIKQTKEQINVSAAHANIVSSGSVFRIADAGDAISAPFFDIEDEYFVKVALWRIGSVAITLMDLFYGVNQGRDVLDFCPDFALHLQHAAKESDALLDELKATDRFKRAAEKYGLPGAP